MKKPGSLKFDEIGYWSEIKLDIVREYAQAYSTILKKQPSLSHAYIDAFSGPGLHKSKTTGGMVPGSPLNALQISPPFDDYYFIDLDGDKLAPLKTLVGNNPNVHFFRENCNLVLLRDVFPKVRHKARRRALCLLDPYGLHLNWEVVEAAGKEKAIDIFLNFPIADMNRNVFWRNPAGVDKNDIERMNAFWGDENWREVAYTSIQGLFGPMEERADHRDIVEAYRQRLRDMAQFKHIPEPIPMRNSKHAIVYYLFFASQKPVASKIVQDIFSKYRNRMT